MEYYAQQPYKFHNSKIQYYEIEIYGMTYKNMGSSCTGQDSIYKVLEVSPTALIECAINSREND